MNKRSVIACVLLLTGSTMTQAVNLTWDANTSTTGAQDGSGTWDAVSPNWWSGTANALWNSATPDTPFFGIANGAAGTVTLGANIVSANITFNAPGAGNYTIAGGGFTLGLTNRTVIVNVNGTISANIVGTAVTVANGPANSPSGILTLSGANGQTGNFNIGTSAANTTAAVRAGSSTAFGFGQIAFNGQGNASSPRLEIFGGITLTNTVTLSGRNNVASGVESFSGANTFSGPFTPGAGGSQYAIQVDGASTLTLAGPLTVQANGGRVISLRGTGNGTISGVIAGGTAISPTNILDKAGSGTWTFSGVNTHVLSTVVGDGTLALDYSINNNAKLSSIMPLTLAGGTLSLNGGSFTEAVGSNRVAVGGSAVTRPSGTSTLRMNSIFRSAGGTVNFGAASIAETDTLNVNGILGGYATVGGANWAINSTGAGDGPITAYSSYTDIAATGSTIADGATSNVRLNSAGGGGNIGLGAPTTTVNTLLQNTSTPATVNTTGGILRLGATGGVLIPASAQSLTIGTAIDSGTLTAGGADNTPGEVILINNSANALTVNSTIADNGSGVVDLTKSGTGSATLTGNNTHTGTNYVVGGTLNVSSAANLSSGTVVINGGTLNVTADTDLGARTINVGAPIGYGGGTINVGGGATLTVGGAVANNAGSGSAVSSGFAPVNTAGILSTFTAGSLTKTGPGTLVLNGVNSHMFGTIINGGTVRVIADSGLGGGAGVGAGPGNFIPDNIILNGGALAAAATFTMSANRGVRLGPINGSGSGTITVDNSEVLTFNGQISDNWAGSGSLIKNGTGVLVLGGAVNDYSGDTTISAGTIQLNNARAIPNGAGKGNLVLNGALNINGFNVGLNGLSGSSSGTLDNLGGVPATLTVGNVDAGGTFNGVLMSSVAPLSLNKVGTGTLTLGGANTHSGATTIANGVLALNASGSLAASTNVHVGASGTLNVTGLSGSLITLGTSQTLSGFGTVQGNVADSSSSVIAPGTIGSAGTLTASGNLALNGAGSLSFDLSTSTTPGGGVNDMIVVNGTLNIAGVTALNLNFLTGTPGLGTYTLFQYNAFAGNAANITVPLGFAITNDTIAKTIGLIVTHIPASLTWRGDGAGNAWDSATANWIQSGTNQIFLTGDAVLFDDTGSNNTAINVAPSIFPTSTTVNAAQNYTFTGNGIGAGRLTKGGAGTLTLDNNNTYAGPTVINSGSLQVGNGGTTGTLGTGPTTNNGAVFFNRSDDLTYTNSISGTGTLYNNGPSGTVTLGGNISGGQQVIMSGNGNLVLSGSNSFNGITSVASGVLHVQNGSALGATGTGTEVQNNAQLFIDANVNIGAEPLTISGSGPLADGALRKGGAGVTIYAGPVTMTADAMIKNDGNSTLILTNNSGITGFGFNLSLAGDGGSQGTVVGPINLGIGSLTESGTGTWTLMSSNGYTGKTFLNGGTLRVASTNSLGPVSAFTADYVLLNGGSLGVATNVTFNDGLRGITASGPGGGFNVDAGLTLTIGNDITGIGVVTKAGAGTLALVASNSFTGTLNIDTASTTVSDGAVLITTSSAIGSVTGPIAIRNNNGGSSTLQLDGSAGGVVVNQALNVSCRNNIVPTIQNVAGNNTLAGGISLFEGGNTVTFQSDAGLLTQSGVNAYIGVLTGARTYVFSGAGAHLLSGPIIDSVNGAPISLTKIGTGTLTLAAGNTYGTTTTISNGLLVLTGSITSTGGVAVVGGTLAGTGTINDSVTVGTGGTLAPGTSIGTLTINGALSLAGNTLIEVNKTAATNDLVTGPTSINYGGTLTVNNLSGTINLSDTFHVFTAGGSSGNFTSIAGSPGPGLAWNFNPATGTIGVQAGVATNPTNITHSVSGNQLTLSWPADHTGWTLQTNAVGLSTPSAWFPLPGSTATNQVILTIDRAKTNIFFRLIYP